MTENLSIPPLVITPIPLPSPAFPPKVETYRRKEPKIGRNEKCPCGSGKKFKVCCKRTKKTTVPE